MLQVTFTFALKYSNEQNVQIFYAKEQNVQMFTKMNKMLKRSLK